VILLPGEKDARVGYLTVACVFAGVFAVLRVVWPRPKP
jgi:hypothetical protein